MHADFKADPVIVFKFKQKMLVLVILAVLVLPLLAGSIAGYAQQGVGLGMLIVALLLCLFCIFISILICIGRADIVIDDRNITRVLFGKTIRRIGWDNVRLVRVNSLARWDSRKQVNGYNIFASSIDATSPRTKKIYFGDYNTDVHKLIEVMNFYIEKNNIPVERVIDGKCVSTNLI